MSQSWVPDGEKTFDWRRKGWGLFWISAWPYISSIFSFSLDHLCPRVQILDLKLGKNSTDTLLSVQSLLTDNRLRAIVGTCKTSVKWRVRVLEGRRVEPVLAISSPILLPICTSSPPLYGAWSERLARSEVRWWEAPESRSQDGVSCPWCCVELEDWLISLNMGHRFALWPWVPQAWQRPKWGLELRWSLLYDRDPWWCPPSLLWLRQCGVLFCALRAVIGTWDRGRVMSFSCSSKKEMDVSRPCIASMMAL